MFEKSQEKTVNIIISGLSGAGKSKLIQNLIREKKLKVRGYFSAKIDCLEGEKGTPIFIMPIPKRYKGLQDAKSFLEKRINSNQVTSDAKCPCVEPAFSTWASRNPSPECIGFSLNKKTVADTKALDCFAQMVLFPMAKEAKTGDILVLDEIGVVESRSELFKDAIRQLLDGPATVVAAVREKHTDFLDYVRNHPQSQCFFLEETNRIIIYEEIKKRF